MAHPTAEARREYDAAHPLITFRLQPATVLALTTAAVRLETTKSDVLRDALKAYLGEMDLVEGDAVSNTAA